MFRTLALAAVAAVSLGAAALAPSAASAHGPAPYAAGHHGARVHHVAPAPRWHNARAHMRHRSCLQKHVVRTPHGRVFRTVNVCR